MRVELEGIVKQGLRHASGEDIDGKKYPDADGVVGTISKQKPFFKEVIPESSRFFNGTINLDITPNLFRILNPDYEVTCQWKKGVTETFWFVDVDIKHNHSFSKGFVYYPGTSEIKRHTVNNMFELLAPKMPDVNYGDAISILYSPVKIKIYSKS